MKYKVFMVLIALSLCLVVFLGCVRPTVEEAGQGILIEDAPYIIEFRNSGWIDGAIFVQNYEKEGCYLRVIGYYDREGFHSGVRYIPIDWVIAIIER